jgi:hypothetical protein
LGYTAGDNEVSSIPDLHDATLQTIEVNWPEATCKFNLGLWGQQASVLVFREFKRIVIPRELDWGPSSSLLSFKATADGQFRVEMQSGDVISVFAESFSLLHSGAEV